MCKKAMIQKKVMMFISELLSENGNNEDVDLLKLADSFMKSICTEKRNNNSKTEFSFAISDDFAEFEVIIRVEGEKSDISHEIEFHRIN